MKEKVYVIPIDELGRGYFPIKRVTNDIMIFGGNVDYVAEDESATISEYEFRRTVRRVAGGNYTPIDYMSVLAAEIEEESIMSLSIPPTEFKSIYPIYKVNARTSYVFFIWIKPFIYEKIDTTNQHLVEITNALPEHSSWKEGSGKIRIIPLENYASRLISENGSCRHAHQFNLNLRLQGHSENALRNAAQYVSYNKRGASELCESINMNFFRMPKSASGLISFEDPPRSSL